MKISILLVGLEIGHEVVVDVRSTNIGIQNSKFVKLTIHKSICKNISNSLVELEIGYVGVVDIRYNENSNKNLYNIELKVYTSMIRQKTLHTYVYIFPISRSTGEIEIF